MSTAMASSTSWSSVGRITGARTGSRPGGTTPRAKSTSGSTSRSRRTSRCRPGRQDGFQRHYVFSAGPAGELYHSAAEEEMTMRRSTCLVATVGCAAVLLPAAGQEKPHQPEQFTQSVERPNRTWDYDGQ